MELFMAIIALIFVTGVALAIYEWRKGKTLLAHDLRQTGPQTEADREALRANDVLIGKATGGFDGH